MGKKRTTRDGYKGRFKAYEAEGRLKKNKDKKLAKHLMKHPNDSQSAQRAVPTSYKRKKPLSYFEKAHNAITNILNSRKRNKRK